MTKTINYKIPYVNLSSQYLDERDEILKTLDNVLKSGNYVGGDLINSLESKIAKYIGVKEVICLNSGTDALLFSLKALDVGEGDEVITQANSFISSTSVIKLLGAKPIYVDVGRDQQIDVKLIEKSITNKTKCIIPVHLTGRIGEIGEIKRIAKKNKIKIIEDAAQSFGSTYEGKKSGSLGDFGAFSAHPLKNFNACGDAGFVTTNNKKLAKKIRLFANHGMVDRNNSVLWGNVSRLDALQAAILSFRLKKINKVISIRRKNAKLYKLNLDKRNVYFPPDRLGFKDSYHTFVIQVEKRNKLKKYLSNLGITTAVHYPIPIHIQPVGKSLGYQKGDLPETEIQAKKILTLPINQSLSEEDILIICEKINRFYNL